MLLFSLVFLIHLLGDYYLQSEKLAIKKEKNYLYLLYHVFIHIVISAIFAIVFGFERELIHLLGINLVTHLLIDTIKFIFRNNSHKKCIYLLDQLFHIITIVILVVIFNDQITLANRWATNYSPYLTHIQLITAIALIAKPANVTFLIIFKGYKPKSDEDLSYQETNNVGKYIGIIERLIVVLLYLLNSLGAIALIIAAKTLTRYQKITEDKEFAEYYLLGTLYSLLFSLGTLYLFLYL